MFYFFSVLNLSQYGPCNVEDLEPGKTMKWCTCGLSKTQPWCDGEFDHYLSDEAVQWIAELYFKLFHNTLAVIKQKYGKAIFLVISHKCYWRKQSKEHWPEIAFWIETSE